MLTAYRTYFVYLCVAAPLLVAQEPAATPVQQQRITGSITAVDPATHVAMVKEDKTGTEYSVELQNTKSLRKVDPATLDLKKATRITADDLMVGDRVQVFAVKAEDNPNALAARGLILISARELQSVHQEQAAAWQHATRGVVTEIAGDGKFTISQRAGQETKTVTIDAQKAEFTRYSVADPKVPAASKFSDVQVGDQVRVIGDAGSDGSTPTGSTLIAQRVYSSPIRMLVCTVSGIAADGKSITVKDLQNKQTVTVALNDDSAVRKLPEMMAMGLARRLNPAAAGAGAGGPGANSGNGNPGSGTANPQAGARPGEAATPAGSGGNWHGSGGAAGANGTAGAAPSGEGAPGGGSGGMRPGGGMRNGDLSQMLDRVPKISASELKPGDAVMVAGVPVNNDKSHLLATNVIAGVEPIFQAASPRQMQSLGDWGLSAGAGGADGMSQQ